MKGGPIDLLYHKAQSLLRLAEKDPLEAERRFNALPFFEKMALVLSLRRKDREKLILLSTEPQRLVENMPEEEFYFTIKELGEEDSLTLLELASPQQIAFCLDLEVWKKNRLKPQKMLKWIELLMDCGEEKAIHVLRNLDYELLVTFLKRYLKVYKPDSPIEEVELDLDLFTLDHHYYIHIRFRQAEEILERLLDMIFRWDQALYRDLLEGVIWEIPGEVEELARRWRQGRLADRGFPEWEEAMEIYRFVKPELIRIENGIKDRYGPDDQMKQWEGVGSNFYLLPLPGDSFLKEVLEEASKKGFGWIRGELVYLCNKAMVADGVDPSDLEAVKALFLRVYDYLNLGLTYLSGGDLEEAFKAVRKLYLKEIFQLGFSLTFRLHLRLQKILEESPWFFGEKKRLSLLDPPLREFAQGLLNKKPLFYEGIVNRSSVNYRTFKTLEEIRLAEEMLDKIEAISELHSKIYGWDPPEIVSMDFKGFHPSDFYDLTFNTLTLTALAQRELGKGFVFKPLEKQELLTFLHQAFEIQNERTSSLKSDFLQRTKAFWEDLIREVEPKRKKLMEDFLREALKEFEHEYTDLDLSQDIDPRFLRLLLLKLE
jgi:hypothetical protein